MGAQTEAELLEGFERYTAGFCAPATVEVYVLGARRFLESLPGSLAEVGQGALVDYVTAQRERGLSGGTITSQISALPHFVKYLRLQGFTLPELIKPEIPRVRRALAKKLSVPDLEKYMKHARRVAEPMRTLMLLLPLTGLRITEACQLRVIDIQPPEPGGLYVFQIRGRFGKSMKSLADREVVVLSAGTEIFSKYCRQVFPKLPGFRGSRTVYVFPDTNGEPLRRRTVERAFKRIQKIIKVPDLTPHACRHAHATLCKRAGMSVFDIMKQLGHESIATTQLYVESSLDDRMKTAAQVDDSWADE